MTKLLGIAILAAAAVVLSACGDSENATKTVVQTVVQTVAADAPAPTQPGVTPPATTTDSAGPPLPDGVIAADGTYEMKFKRSSYEGENIAVQQETPYQSKWEFTTTCKSGECAIAMRRELASGAYKAVTLHPAAGRPNIYEAQSSGTTRCVPAATGRRVKTSQRYSLKLNTPVDRSGRKTARKLDVYLNETTNLCKSKPARGIVSWRGNLTG